MQAACVMSVIPEELQHFGIRASRVPNHLQRLVLKLVCQDWCSCFVFRFDSDFNICRRDDRLGLETWNFLCFHLVPEITVEFA